jgi:hypothetical protein
MERLIAAVTLLICFLVMASIFAPGPTQAGERDGHDQQHLQPEQGVSTDPHAGLLSLGMLEDSCYAVHIYATSHGPRYSIYDSTDGEELGVLLSAEQVERYFPELPLSRLDFSATTTLMLAEPDA